MQDEERIDEFLDRALSEYSSATARMGLEGRILANLQAPQPHKKWLWAWAAVPIAAVILVIVLLWRPVPKKIEVANVVPPRVSSNTQPPKRIVAPRPTEAVRPSVPRQKHAVRSAPKMPDAQPRLATFPSQDSNDELLRAALRFAQAHPSVASEISAEQKQFSEMAAAFTEPLTGNEK
jgi:hypothetical protein